MRNIFNVNRRLFLKTASVSSIAAIGIPSIISSALAAEKTSSHKIKFSKDDVVLFQGDSITDWGRDHSKNEPNTTSALGSGYTLITASKLLLENPEKNLSIYNRGIGGNKVYQLAERWDADCLALKPNILSIHIGVNDFWHTLTGGYTGTIETYITDYKKLITRTKQALPDVQLVIGEPFALKGVKAVDDKWYPAFDQYRKAARDIATEFGAVFVPYQAAFDKAVQAAPAPYWNLDGVHPSVAGEALMAQTWLKAVGA
jgi:lysophospholipase L1-like esterase